MCRVMNSLRIRKPVIIIGCPRSGTSLLFRILSTSKDLWSLYRESNDIWESFYDYTGKDFQDEVLNESDLDDSTKEFLLTKFHKYSLNNYYLGYLIREYLLKRKILRPSVDWISTGSYFYKKAFCSEYRLVEKTPKNCFRIPFINKLFDDCRFIFLKRDGRSNINSLIDGWKAKNKYIRARLKNVNLNIKGYDDKHWKFALPPGWKDYTEKSLEEVCAFQWISSNKAALDGLNNIENKRKYEISYEELSENTFSIMEKLCNFVEIPFSKELREVSQNLPVVNSVTKPEKDKWKKNEEVIKKVYPVIEPMMNNLGYKLI